MDPVKERFWDKVNKAGECWTWMRYTMPNGYAQFYVEGKQHYIHRLSYEWAFGAIPAGLEVDHKCHTRHCVNPDHLRLATRKQNNENIAGPLANSKSGVRGIYWHNQRGKWHARVGHNGRKHNLGLFADISDAEAAVIAKRNELFTHNDLDRKAS